MNDIHALLVANRSEIAIRVMRAAAELGISRASTSAEALAREIRPDVFCFCTQPAVRLDLIRIGIGSGARLIAY